MNKLYAGKTIQEIVNEYSSMLIRVAFQNVKNKADAEDIVQETYIKLLKYNTSFTDTEHLKAWLIRVTINRSKDHLRSSWFKRTELKPDDLNIFKEDDKRILEDVFTLSRNHRNVIYLYYYEGYSIKEIANILNKNNNTVSSLLQRGRVKLKKILEEGVHE